MCMRRLFSVKSSPFVQQITLLWLRIGLGVLMIPTYGYGKLVNFEAKKDQFYDFLGIGGSASMALAIFAEFFCSILLILGLFTRLATIALIVTMIVIISVHDWDLFNKHELAPAFLVGYVAIFLMGPGKYSLDALIQQPASRRR
jgi:putative oxidoreductase